MEPPTTQEEGKNHYREFLRPFNLISLSVTVLSILMAVWFYHLSREYRSFAYAIPNRAQKVVDNSSRMSPLAILDEQGNHIEENVYLTQIPIWNNGDLPIEPEVIRKSVSIDLYPCNKIIEAKVIDQTHPDVAQVRVEVKDSVQDSLLKRVVLKWQHLDPEYGARIQILYSGTDTTYASFSGQILGVKEFYNANKPILNRYIGNEFFYVLLGMGIPVAIMLGSFFLIANLGYRLGKKWPRFESLVFWIIAIFGGTIVAFIVIWFFQLATDPAELPPI